MTKGLTDDERCSMCYWFPLIEAKVPTPRTVFVPLPGNFESWLDSGIPRSFVEKLRETVQTRKFGYPIFMRTDQLASKHDWENTCYVSSPEKLGGNLALLLDSNLSLDMAGELVPKAIVLREFLELEFTFKAFKNMPIAREYRLFTEDGKVLCWHPYWKADAIEFWNPEDKVKVREMLDKGASLEDALKYRSEPPGWREQLASISQFESKQQMDRAFGIASRVTEIIGGAWSVDVCVTKRGELFMTDMAVAERSYHWEGCPKAKKAKL